MWYRYRRHYSAWLRTGRPVFDPRQKQRMFPLTSASRPALEPTQSPIQWVPRVFSQRVKRGRGVMLTTHPLLLPSLRKSRSYTSSPPSASMACSGTTLPLHMLMKTNQATFINKYTKAKPMFRFLNSSGIFRKVLYYSVFCRPCTLELSAYGKWLFPCVCTHTSEF
jgi:hypothetical protein